MASSHPSSDNQHTGIQQHPLIQAPARPQGYKQAHLVMALALAAAAQTHSHKLQVRGNGYNKH
jgi:hypothetical protein